MYYHQQLNAAAFLSLYRAGEIKFGGYKPAKIYGTLRCKSGTRMHATNRVFFASEQEAIDAGYRPCARCMPARYRAWKEEKLAGSSGFV